jgi:hypothetical protein
MRNTKHVGKLANTQKKVVVVFRELPDDPKHCLVVDTDALADWMHDDVINAVEAPGAQASPNFYEYAERTVMADGTNMLQTLHKTGRLMKQATDNVLMTPNAEVAVGLTEINNIVREETKGAKVVAPPADETPMAGKEVKADQAATAPVAESAKPGETLDDTQMAKNLLAQAKSFESEAKNLKAQAYELAPGLKPGPKKTDAKVTEPAE